MRTRAVTLRAPAPGHRTRPATTHPGVQVLQALQQLRGHEQRLLLPVLRGQGLQLLPQLGELLPAVLLDDEAALAVCCQPDQLRQVGVAQGLPILQVGTDLDTVLAVCKLPAGILLLPGLVGLLVLCPGVGVGGRPPAGCLGRLGRLV